MQIELEKIIVENNSAESRFEVRVDEYLAVIDYYREGNEIVFTHTGVPDAIASSRIIGMPSWSEVIISASNSSSLSSIFVQWP